jgi:acetylornithine deacetylase
MTNRFLTAEELLERLISFKTVSDQSNRGLTDFVCAYLSWLGVAFETSTDVTGEKVAILATIGPMKDGGVVLSGHTDVVPVSGQSWSSDPFSLQRDGDRLVGRGAVDMKGFCATALAMLPAFREVTLARPLHLLLSYDEETTGAGSLQLIERFGQDLPQPSGAVIGEPTEMKVAVAHKGIVSYQTKIDGIAAHASRPTDGVNAIDLANDAISFLRTTACELQTAPFCDERFDPCHTTVHVGVINGGAATNIVPSECTFGWEVRNVPTNDIDLVHSKFQTWANDLLAANFGRRKDVAITTTTMCKLPALATDARQDIVRLALKLANQPDAGAVPFATEAGHFQRAGISAVVCGPGSITQAHRPDEHISVAEIRRYESFLLRLRDALTT